MSEKLYNFGCFSNSDINLITMFSGMILYPYWNLDDCRPVLMTKVVTWSNFCLLRFPVSIHRICAVETTGVASIRSLTIWGWSSVSTYAFVHCRFVFFSDEVRGNFYDRNQSDFKLLSQTLIQYKFSRGFMIAATQRKFTNSFVI